MVDYDIHYCEGANGLKRPVFAACNFCYLKTKNYIEVQKYLFGINGLILAFYI